MIVNRIADVFFILAILLIFLTFKTTDYALVFNLIPFIASDSYLFLNMTMNKIQIIAFFLFIGAIGKSAQIGMHTWLPDAMEGPTPVSSLLHAATMVTAGVFMIVRCSVIFEYSESVLMLLILFGGFTALFAGLVAIFHSTWKKLSLIQHVVNWDICFSLVVYLIIIWPFSIYLTTLFSKHFYF